LFGIKEIDPISKDLVRDIKLSVSLVIAIVRTR